MAALSSTRKPFTLFDLARVRNGRIVPTHVNNCPALDGGACTCADTQYRMVRTTERRVR